MRSGRKLSQKKQRMLEFIRDFMTVNSRPPTIRDIQSACHLSSTSVVDYNLRLLEREGFLRRQPDVARGLELLEEDGSVTSFLPRISVIGYISAGEPLPGPSSGGWNPSEPLDVIELPRNFIKNKGDAYGLRVKGTSMIDALIDDGDVVVIEPSHDANNGDMIVAWLKEEQEATLKRFYREGKMVRLQPANSQMKPIYSKASNVETHGKVIAILRTT